MNSPEKHMNYSFVCEEQIHFKGKNIFLIIRDPVEFKSVSLYEFFFNCTVFEETHDFLTFRNVLKDLNF